MTAALLRADSVALPLADDSVDLIITSPPYFALRSYTDDGEHYAGQIGSEPTPREFLDALWAVTRECARVLKPSGSMFVNLGDKYAGSGGHNNSNLSQLHQNHGRPESDRHRAADDGHRATRRNAPDAYNKASDVRAKSLMGLPWLYANGCTGALAAIGGPDPGLDLIHRAELVWSKPNGLPESVTDRVRRSHEQWFHLTGQGDYYSAVDEVREGYAPGTAARYAAGYNERTVDAERQSVNTKLGGDTYGENPLGKLPGSVWTIPSEPLKVPTFIDGQPWGTSSVFRDKKDTRRRKLWRYAEQRYAAGLPCDVWGVDHFAAFPQEWPRRLILGWSPPGICVECDEGRRPVVDKTREVDYSHADRHRGPAAVDNNPTSSAKAGAFGRWLSSDVTVTGYACACDEPTAPTRPAVVLDPFGGTGTTAMVARVLGRFGVSVDLSNDYLRLARWRIFQSGHGAKSVERTAADAQLDLMGLAS